MRRMLLVVCVLAVAMMFIGTMAQSAEKGKKAKALEWKVKGQIIAHPETGDVKLLTENYETFTFGVNEKTKINASIKAKIADMAKESEKKLPKGEVTYTLIDGKPVATKVTYGSSQKWKMQSSKKKED